MKIFVSNDIVWINYGERSRLKFLPQLTTHLYATFGAVETSNVQEVKTILTEAFDWRAATFENLVKSTTDPLLFYCLFKYHECSILLWQRTLTGEDIAETLGINEDALSMNRRVLKLALEQCCDVDYTGQLNVSQERLTHFDTIIEDLLFVGDELVGFGQYLAEIRMLPGTFTCKLSESQFDVTRPADVEGVVGCLKAQAQIDYTRGIMDDNATGDLKAALQRCMGINYDATCAMIVYKKNIIIKPAGSFKV
ncbi:hypothetical protein [Chitinophaga filiformis]|uniref:Uncharacterized protein n=1 Tax=Chitinophaga filiformis TaxID=104663 RepID=A0ABY4HVZ5_CHIFI|nr:hypothetical protein [Chitinophaga filiformis]UPK67955.1 hypothetical protein MYF79_23670 [Chitinophaga filiformis]